MSGSFEGTSVGFGAIGIGIGGGFCFFFRAFARVPSP